MSSQIDVTDDVIGIIQPFVPNYRRPLFDAIDRRLAVEGLRLEVWHDFPKGRVAARGNADSGTWSSPIKQRRLSIGRRNITYRNVRERSRRAAAVVTGLASTNVETYGLASDSRVKLMLWGHGRNFTAKNYALDARLEGWLARRSNHIFSYTEEGKRHLVAGGLRDADITVVVNSTDTDALREIQAATTTSEIEEMREQYNLGDSRVALFVGAFDGPKQLPFLIESMDEVHRTHPELVLLLAGAGPDEALLEEMASTRSWVRLIGRLDSSALARISRLVDMILMPGRVGLVAVDALALGIPIVTSDYPFHAPEAGYLTDGHDSMWAKFNKTAYAEAVQGLLDDQPRLKLLSDNAREVGRGFSVDQSAKHFVSGIMSGLNR